MTKAERREQARRERLELQRKMARTRRNRRLAVIAAVVIVGAAVVAVVSTRSPSSTATPGQLAGVLDSKAPWPANTQDLGQRLRVLGLPPEGGALHHHAFLAISVDGSPVTVPADIGLAVSTASPLHTHDTTGVIHIESGNPSFSPTLGEFFDVWGVRLTSSCLGGYCTEGDQQLRVFLNGRPVQSNPRSVPLKEHDDVVVAFGTAAQVPQPLPTFDWSSFQG
jgi:hypothetical protein